MPKSLADLRAEPKKPRAERTITVCLESNLVAEMQSLSEQLALLPVDSGEEPTGPPKRKADPRKTERRRLTDRMEQLLAEMAEDEGELRVRANLTDGEWRIWVNEHPARDEGEPGYDRDLRVTGGFCNADDLIDDLGRYVCSWNGEPLTAEDWPDVVEPLMSPPDKAQAATEVVGMYEVRRDFRQWRNSLSASLTRSNASEQPAPSASHTSDSTAGSPALFDAATTGTANG